MCIICGGRQPGSARVARVWRAALVAEKTAKGNLLDNTIAENARRQADRIKTSPPIMQQAYKSKKIDIVAATYAIATGRITLV